jgi:hypothetical protein
MGEARQGDSRIVVAPASDAEVPRIIAIVAERLPELAIDNELVMAVHRHSRSLFFVKRDEELIGCFAALFLTDTGLERLLAGTLSVVRPPLDLLAGAGERAAAIYEWMFMAPSSGTEALSAALKWLSENGYGAADIYGRPINAAIEPFLRRIGAAPCIEQPALWVRHHAAPAHMDNAGA